MKKIKRVSSAILIFLGVIATFSSLCTVFIFLTSAEAENKLLSVICALACVLLSLVILYLGYRLRHPKAKTQPTQPGNSSTAKPANYPPKPGKLTPEEKKRQQEEAEERERMRREQAEMLKKMRMKFLEPWSNIDPDEAEHIAQWEAALASDCAITNFYMISGRDDEGLDGTHDGTGVDWLYLSPDSNLEKAITMYAQIDTYRKACEAHDVYAKNTQNSTLHWLMNRYHDSRFLIISAGQFDALGENTEPCLALCREHDLHIVTSLPEDRYKDYVSGQTYEVYVGETFPGSADDAATYGNLCLRVI